jgi:hypothetical protein
MYGIEGHIHTFVGDRKRICKKVYVCGEMYVEKCMYVTLSTFIRMYVARTTFFSKMYHYVLAQYHNFFECMYNTDQSLD